MRVRDEDVEELRQLEESLWRSETRFDLDYMDRVLAPDFVEFGRSNRIYQRQDTLAVPWQETMANLPLKNFDAHFIDTNVVLVTYVSEVMYRELEVDRRSSIWLRTSAGWQLRFHQGTPVI